VQGSVEAVTEALRRLSTPRVKVVVVHSAVGAITGSDVNLASTSGAVIIGFNVRPDAAALQVIEQTKVDVKLYGIIYEAVDGVLAAMEGRLPTTTIEKYLGRAEVRQIFNAPKVGTIAGCSVIDGKIMRSARIRLLRDSAVVHDGKLASLKRFKDDVREVAQGYECGMNLDGYNDVKPGDLIEAYELIEVATKLDGSTAARESHAEA
ncbi:MAG: translation initiation factor IF-2, partial [Deltaproteobacteria bacterium]|nr:translation initiation factor IF-2 [Deltaproteobacteria bacterium]